MWPFPHHHCPPPLQHTGADQYITSPQDLSTKRKTLQAQPVLHVIPQEHHVACKAWAVHITMLLTRAPPPNIFEHRPQVAVNTSLVSPESPSKANHSSIGQPLQHTTNRSTTTTVWTADKFKHGQPAHIFDSPLQPHSYSQPETARATAENGQPMCDYRQTNRLTG